MNSTKKEPSVPVISCDDSDDSVIEDKISYSVENSDNFEKTLPPGVAPEGFIILDESIDPIDDKNTEENEDEDEEEGEVTEITEETDERSAPDFKVIFKDSDISRQYRKKIEEFFKSFVSAEFKDEDSNDSNLVLNVWCNKLNEMNEDIQIIDNQLFVIDSRPGKKSFDDIPSYGMKFDRVFDKDSCNNSNGNEENIAAPKLSCFNCLGDHNLRDCKKPRNPIIINKNRREFSVRNGPRNVRYHDDDDNKFTPGVLSNELRKALGLSHNQLPRHIIKMRYLGYPPGWLEEAKLEHSGINLYGSDGRRETDPKEEEGEIFIPGNHIEYDLKKIYDFPGFNTPAPPGTQDAGWDPELQELHSKEKMLRSMNIKKTETAYKRKKLKKSNASKDSPAESPTPMDIEEINEVTVESDSVNGHFIPPLPKDGPLIPPSSSNLDDTNNTQPSLKLIDDSDISINESCDSPSLTELVKKKQLLLEELEDSSSLSNPGTPSLSNISEVDTSISERNKSISTNVNTSTPKVGSVKCIEYGTPILESTSIYTKLPSSEKFSKDICDVINFENLPGATGKYDKLSGVLNKIRKTLSSKDYD